MCRAPSAFARDQLKSSARSATGRTRGGALANNQRLNDAVLSNRIDQFLQGFTGEILARLQRTRDDGGQINLIHPLARLASVWTRRHRRSANQCAKPLAETRPCHAAEATGTVPS